MTLRMCATSAAANAVPTPTTVNQFTAFVAKTMQAIKEYDMKHIETLQNLLKDVEGNRFLGNAKRMSGYLKSISLLSDAMARRSWQQFELDLIEELKVIDSGAEVKKAIEVKVKFAKREYELSELQVNLAAFLANVDAECYFTKENAADELRKIADEIAAKDSELFPKPWSREEFKAYAASIGATYSEETVDAKEFVARMKATNRNATGRQKPSKSKKSKLAVVVEQMNI